MSKQVEHHNDSFSQKIIEFIKGSMSESQPDENRPSNEVWDKEDKAILSDMIEHEVLLDIVRAKSDFEGNVKISLSCSDSREKEHALEMAEVAEYRVRKALLLYLDDLKKRMLQGEINF